jgi:hypothetical protein
MLHLGGASFRFPGVTFVRHRILPFFRQAEFFVRFRVLLL